MEENENEYQDCYGAYSTKSSECLICDDRRDCAKVTAYDEDGETGYRIDSRLRDSIIESLEAALESLNDDDNWSVLDLHYLKNVQTELNDAQKALQDLMFVAGCFVQEEKKNN